MTELFLVAAIAGRRIAIAAAEVESVVDVSVVVPVPHADRSIRGLTALRSRIVTVIETPVALGIDGAITAETPRAVIVRSDAQFYAIPLDEITDVVPLTCAPLTSGLRLEAGWATVATGIADHAGEPLLVVALSRLVDGLENGARLAA